ncbi:MAG: DUF1015 family protein [Alphaproteobacteria bacterium]|nr:DUF1015 family protein [Alphaproteobacteria bacterium]
MITIKPFSALRPEPQFAKLVASKPYDVLNSQEAKLEVIGNPNSFLHITKSEISLSKDIDIHTDEVYEKAKENLEAFIKRDILFKESKDCFYIYKLNFNNHNQTGLVCLSSIDDYAKNLIKKHELTKPDKETDRFNHIKYTKAHTGNVFLTYRKMDDINAIIEKWIHYKSPIYNILTEDQVTHTIWAINETEVINKIINLFKTNVPCSYIADGHHRAASAYKHNLYCKENNLPSPDFFLTTLFPESELKILPYNRIVKTLNGLSQEQFLNKIDKKFIVEKKTTPVQPQNKFEFGLYINKQWFVLKYREQPNIFETLKQLDVNILQDFILDSILDIKDPRTNPNLDFVGGIRGLQELVKLVDNHEAIMAFSLYPIIMDELLQIADQNLMMPPKCTWFEPKLRDGLLTHIF